MKYKYINILKNPFNFWNILNFEIRPFLPSCVNADRQELIYFSVRKHGM